MAEDESTLTEATMATAANREQTLAPVASIEAIIESNGQGGTTDSSCNKNTGVESSSLASDALGLAAELMNRGEKAARGRDFYVAADCLSRALEIRVAHFGELAPECVDSYYKYGCALLQKAQKESDPLGIVPKKAVEPRRDSDDDGSVMGAAVNCESSTVSVKSKSEKHANLNQGAISLSRDTEQDVNLNHQEGPVSASSNVEQDVNTINQEGTAGSGSSSGKNEIREEKTDDEYLAEGDEEDSDLDLAWKMLDIARAIVERHSGDTMEKVDILSSLAEVALEREDIDTSLSDYLKALSILERIVQPDTRVMAELNFRICLCLEIDCKVEEAIPYCQKAISICKSRVQSLVHELKSSLGSDGTESCQIGRQSSSTSQSALSVSDIKSEIENLNGLLAELEKKLEDLQHAAANPKSLLSEILEILRGKCSRQNAAASIGSSQMGTANSNGYFDSPTVSTAHTNGDYGVIHLGVVGRGVKRALMNNGSVESSPAKRHASRSSPKND